MLRKILFTAVVLTGLLASPASAQYSFVVTPGEVAPGATVSVTGNGCEPGSEVSLTIASDEPAKIGTTTADDEGDFNVTVTIPADIEPGEHTVTATCGDHVSQQTIRVIAATPPPTAPGTPASPSGVTPPGGATVGPLPVTGSNLNGFGLVGAGLLAAGGFLLVATRRRRATL